MLTPPLSAALIQRIEQSDRDYTHSRLGGMGQAAGNLLGIEIQTFGQAAAFLIRGWPDFWYGNKVLGLGPADASRVPEIVAYFRRHQLSFRFELAPQAMNAELGTALHRQGLCQMGFNTALYGRPAAGLGPAPSSAVEVTEARPEELDLFWDLYQAGFGLPRLTAPERAAVRAWQERDANDLYLCMARVGGIPAGVSILFIKNGTGLMADAAALPAFRGQGCHSALVRQRLAAAAERGCDLLTSFVEFGSASQRNLERAGLRVAYTKAMWWAAELE